MLDIAPHATEIDADAVIACPAKGFKPRRAHNCARCPFCAGLAVLGTEGNWSQRYAIRCAHVIERRTQIIDVLED